MLIGYCRVSTHEQSLDLQIDALREAGCERVFQDTASGVKAERPGLAEALDFAREGDVITVWKLDRLGRSLRHLIETVHGLEARGVGFRSLMEQIDSTTPTGTLLFHIMGALAQFERDLIRARTTAGLAAARARGRRGGRRPALDPSQVDAARKLHQQRTPVAAICRLVGCSRSSLYRHLKQDHGTGDET